MHGRASICIGNDRNLFASHTLCRFHLPVRPIQKPLQIPVQWYNFFALAWYFNYIFLNSRKKCSAFNATQCALCTFSAFKSISCHLNVIRIVIMNFFVDFFFRLWPDVNSVYFHFATLLFHLISLSAQVFYP